MKEPDKSGLSEGSSFRLDEETHKEIEDEDILTIPREADEPTAIREKDGYRSIKHPRTFGRFQLLMEMGHGGMATLYLARIIGPESFEKLVAIKKIHDHLTSDKEFIEMFLDEARLAARIHHPNVVTIFDLGFVDEIYFIAMEYVHGQNLTDLLRAAVRQHRTLPWPVVARIVADSAAGLHAAHQLTNSEGMPLNVVHRDVSPQNILVSYDGHVKVVDFGIAFAAEKISHTSAGSMKGKAGYMSPEQTRDQKLDRRSDIFSLGILLWEGVCLKRLFRCESEAATLLAVRKAQVAKPRSVGADIPDELERIIMKALALKPEDRFATAGELSERLEELLVGQREVVSNQRVSNLMGKLFYDRKKVKEIQIKQALRSPSSEALQAVSMGAATSTRIDMPESYTTGKRKPRRTTPFLVLALGLFAVAGAMVFWTMTRGSRPRRTHQEHATQGALAGASDREADGSHSQGGEKGSRPGTSDMVTLRVTVQPEEAEAVITFKSKKYKGPVFKAVVPRSDGSETLLVEAPGFRSETVLVYLLRDREVNVRLQPVKPRVPVMGRPRRKSHHRLLKKLPF